MMTENRLPRWVTWGQWVLVALLLAVLGFYLFVYVRYAVALIQFPFDYDQGEGFELNDTLYLARGEWPYRSFEAFPFYSSNYPPLYHLVLVPFVWLFGPAYWYGRLFSFLATLLTAAAIGYAVWRDGRVRHVRDGRGVAWVAVAMGLFYLSSNYVYHVGPLFRQHINMVMLETLAIVLLADIKHVADPAANVRRDNWRIVWALVLLMAAGYTKQLAYATVIAAFVFLLFKGVRRAVVSGAIFGAVGLTIFGALNVVTGGEWWFHIVISNINEFVPGQFEGLFWQWYGLHAILLWLGAAGVIAWSWRQPDWGWKTPSVYAIWLAAAIANSTLAGKWGAGESYFVTAIAAMCIGAGLLVSGLQQLAEQRGGVSGAVIVAVLPLLLLVQSGRLVHMPTQGRLFGPIAQVLNLPTDQPYYDSQGYTQLGRPPNQIDTEQGYKILAYTQAVDGPVFTEEASFSLLAGHEQVGNPTQLLNVYNADLLDTEPLVTAIETQQFNVIILKAEFYPPPVLEAIGQYYKSIATEPMNGFYYRVLVPRSAEELPEQP